MTAGREIGFFSHPRYRIYYPLPYCTSTSTGKLYSTWGEWRPGVEKKQGCQSAPRTCDNFTGLQNP